jgi:hypothetical protein
MNKLSPELITGTVGELLVQLRLLEFSIQAAPPLKDSGNDLIAMKGRSIKACQVKTTAGDRIDLRRLPKLYDLLVAVHLVGEGPHLYLDQCGIYLIPAQQIQQGSYQFIDLEEFKLSEAIVNRYFT